MCKISKSIHIINEQYYSPVQMGVKNNFLFGSISFRPDLSLQEARRKTRS